MFNPRFMAQAKRLVPSAFYERLDPFEAEIQKFVRNVAAEIPAGMSVLDAGAGECRIQPVGGFFWQLGRRLMGVLAFAQTGWRWLLFPVLAPVCLRSCRRLSAIGTPGALVRRSKSWRKTQEI